MIQQFLFETGLPVFGVFIGQPIHLHSPGDRCRAAQCALLALLLSRRSGTATTDDIVRDLNAEMPDGGKWLGVAVRELADDGLIRWHKATRSKRRARHSGLLSVWQLCNRAAARRRLSALKAALQFVNEATPSAGTGGVAKSDTTQHNSDGGLSDATK